MTPILRFKHIGSRYRSWLLMRCRQVWPCDVETVQDHKLLVMIQFWHEVQWLSPRELLFPLRWEGKIAGHISIASVLDFLIRTQEQIPPTVCEGIDYDDEAAPWFDAPIQFWLMILPLRDVCKLTHAPSFLRVQGIPQFVCSRSAMPQLHSFCRHTPSWLVTFRLTKSQ